MTKEQAIYSFFTEAVGSQMSVYAATSVPDDVVFPYLTYTMQTASWGEAVSLTVNQWIHTDSEAKANTYVKLMDNAVPPIGGTTILCDEGMLWLRRGNPWCVSSQDENDPDARLRYFNLTVEYLTV